jgi:hypothetical protein
MDLERFAHQLRARRTRAIQEAVQTRREATTPPRPETERPRERTASSRESESR